MDGWVGQIVIWKFVDQSGVRVVGQTIGVSRKLGRRWTIASFDDRFVSQSR